MSGPTSKFWLGESVFIKHDDEAGIIVGVLFENDPGAPSTRYVVSFAGTRLKLSETELTTEKTTK